MSSNRVWAPSNTGTKYHAFMGSIGAKDGNFRAACRVSTQRKKTAHYISRDQIAPWDSVCVPCERAFRAAEDRAEASMMPATEAHDLGYVAPVDERTEAAPQPADLSTEDGTVEVDGDVIIRKGPWATVVLDDDRTYSVSTLVHRKTEGGDPGNGHVIYWDHVIYWRNNDRDDADLKAAGSIDRPTSVAGRIWKLLVAARIVLKCQTCGATDRSVTAMLDPFTTALRPEDTDHDRMTLCEPCAVARFEES
ncbi:hypothetical protein SEA_ABT2GRADUATEX2_65 [Streptomyces phage Abt2graduatex2]|nr:hypothetical protein SEA_ABT2GRADUATEX2_65 [Streptomyces phage Abt2graduatex2]